MAEDQTTQLRRALAAIKDLRARLEALDGSAHAPIAVVGMACRFPGGASTPRAFWRLLVDGGDAVRETPRHRWDVDALYDPDPDATGRVATRWGAFLDDIDRFDAAFFGIAPREAERMDPQQRLLLEVTWEAFESAGLTREQLAGSHTGVFVGVHSHSTDYYALQADDLDVYSGTGTAHNVLGGRLSYLWDLRGPNLVVDTACSSSLVAVHLAVQSLRRGESQLAIAGGVNVMLSPGFTIAASRMRMLAADGRCKAFDERADGFVRGEGCGVVVLKRLADAESDGDPILAVVRGSAVNQDGHTNGLTAPNGLAQREVVRRALEDARVTGSDIGFVETHGTGTPLGDPIEIEALAEVVGRPRDDGRECLLGAVKTNIGHLEGAAGIAGLIKTVLVLQHGVMPANLHFSKVNPHIDLSGTRLTIPTRGEPWPATGFRLAGVSSFGWSGTNAHVVIESRPDLVSDRVEAPSPDHVHLLPLSARTPAALAVVAREARDYLAGHGEDVALGDLVYTASCRRTHHEQRVTVAGSTTQELVESLHAFGRGEARPGLSRGHASATPPGLVFVFPGQGSQWLGMGRELMDREPAFAAALERCDRAIRQEAGWSVVSELQAAPADSRLASIDVVQPVLFTVQLALAELWQSWGVVPDAIVGHSMGEVAAACVAGVLSIEDAVRVVCRRSRELRRLSGQGAMAVAELSEAEATALAAESAGAVSVAVVNGPRAVVLAGSPTAIDDVVAELARREVFARRVNVDVASHSSQVEAVIGPLRAALGSVRGADGHVPFYSTVDGARIEGARCASEYWIANLRQPVLFWQTLQRLVQDGYTAFLEVSPHPVLVPSIEEGLRHLRSVGCALPSLRRDEPERLVLRESLGALHCRGVEVSWSAITGSSGRVVSDLPTYPWQRERFWLPGAPASGAGLVTRASSASPHPLLGCRVHAPEASGAMWHARFSPSQHGLVFEHRLEGRSVMAAGVSVALALAAATEATGSETVELRDVAFERPLLLDPSGETLVQVSARPSSDHWRVELSVRSPYTDAGWTRHMHARAFALDTRTAAEEEIAHAAEELRHGADAAAAANGAPAPTTAMSGAQVYERLEARGIGIGESLRCVARAERRPGHVSAEVEWAGGLLSGPWRQARLLDGCLQPLGLFAWDDETGLRLPSRIHRVRVGMPSRPASGDARVRAHVRVGVRWRDGDRTDADAAQGELDFVLSDETLQMSVLIERMELTALDAHEPRTAPVRVIQPRWVPAPAPAESRRARSGWVIVADRAGVGSALAATFSAQGQANAVVHDIESVPSAIAEAEARFGEGYGVLVLSALDSVLSTGAPADELEMAIRASAEPVLAVVRALNERPGRRVSLHLVTRGAQAVGTSEDSMSLVRGLAQSVVWGLGRTLAQEHADWWGGLIDIDPAAAPAEAAAHVARELFTDAAGDDEVVFRGEVRHVARLEAWRELGGESGAALREETATAPRFSASATYLVTGGFGGVGQDVLAWLAEHGARRVAVLGRTPLPPRSAWSALPAGRPAEVAAALRRAEALGLAVHYAAVDVGDAAALTRFLDEFRGEAWPPIRGVVHAATDLDHALVSRLDSAGFAAAIRAKVVGAWTLHAALGDLDQFVLFSSFASHFPLAGQAAYAAANGFLDALARYRRSSGQPGLAAAWGVWRERGRTQQTDRGRRAVEQLTAEGVVPFSPRAGLAALDALMGTGAAGDAIVASVDWRTFAEHRHRPSLAAFCATLMEPASAAARAAAPVEGQALAGLSDDERRRALVDTVTRTVGLVLKLAPERIDPDAPLGTIGMESLAAIEFRNRLGAALGISLPATLIWNHPTVLAIVHYIDEKMSRPSGSSPAPDAVRTDTVDAPEPERVARPVSTIVSRADDMTEEDALRALLEGGAGREPHE